LGLVAGSGIVVASGLYLLWHEAQAKRAQDAPKAREGAPEGAQDGADDGVLAAQRAPLRP
jgi:hypothetical protein